MIAPFRWRWEGQPFSVPWEDTSVTTSGDSSIQVQADVPSWGTGHSTRGRCRKGGCHQSWTAVCPLSWPSWGAAAAGSPNTAPHDRAHLYHVQLSSVTFKMMAESSGSDPDLLMQFIMNFWRGKQGIVCVLTEITRLSLSILFFFFPPVTFKWQRHE